MRLLWLRPSKGDNISVRRERIAEHLHEHGVEVDIRDASGLDALGAAWKALIGDYDVIAGNVRVGLYLGYPLARLLGTPFLGDVSDPISDIEGLPGPLFRVLEWYEWFVLSRADAAVFVAESSHQEALRRGIDAVRLQNAVDFDRFAEPDEAVVEEARRILEEEGVDPEKPVAIYVGGFTPNYHISDILGAAMQTPSWEFVFVGEGPLVKEVEATAMSTENVHFPGAFEYRLMPGFMAHASVGFCFKNAERPLKLLEYGAAGLPAIVQSGVLEKWYDEDELLFVEPKPETISTLLESVSDSSLDLTDRAKNLRARARESSWKWVAERYLELLEDITGK